MPKAKGLCRREGAATYEYDFQIRGHRFCGSTGKSERREAEKELVAIRTKAAASIADKMKPGPMTFGQAATRWWNEAGKHRKDARNIVAYLAWLQASIGNNKLISEIDNNLVAGLVAKRRGEASERPIKKVKGKPVGKPRPITAGMVNRSMLEPLRAILFRARDIWEEPVKAIAWQAHRLKEPKERVRELTADEEARLFAHLPGHYHAIVKLFLITGMRREELCGLQWSEVDMTSARVVRKRKGGDVLATPLPAAAMAILSTLSGKHPTAVFTNEAGEPLKAAAFASMFWRVRQKAGLQDFRPHDLRHTAASRIMRATGSIKLAGSALGHSNIKSTARYAHISEDDLRAGLERTNPVEFVKIAKDSA